MSLYLQGVRGLTAFDTGVTLLPFAIGSFITAPLAGLLASRFGPKWIVTVGMLTESLALFLLSLVIQPDKVPPCLVLEARRYVYCNWCAESVQRLAKRFDWVLY